MPGSHAELWGHLSAPLEKREDTGKAKGSMFGSLRCSEHSPQAWTQCTQALSLFSSPRESVLTLSIKQACLMSADPGSFSLRKARGLRSAEVCKFPGFSGPEGQCLEALDSGLGCRGMPVGHWSMTLCLPNLQFKEQ